MATEETLGVTEAAALLHAEHETVLLYARRGELPGTRIGKSWVFMREDVLAFLRKQISADTEARRRNNEKPPAALAHPAPRRGRRKQIPELPSVAAVFPAALTNGEN
ncbi:helix-turn-helix domain-containing protein [Massilia scottii]|uniref:helix-turn-helix domain-containing protein n=1 Tax=Massilia scottii TaxID=3057166 RepID=UPI0027965FA8|nr:helix-turn-helix domain-containing protein [Massilia sp. CCM 9029]MDQ1835526.1 helix-turn-helix domain-containing protein [Massilia sp. CCM 9029]